MNEEVGGDEGKRRRHGRKGEREISTVTHLNLPSVSCSIPASSRLAV